MRCKWQVLGALRAAADLVPTLDQLEAGFRRYIATRRPEGPFAEFLPFASDQVTDWEAAAAGNGATADSIQAEVHQEHAVAVCRGR